MCMSFNNHRIRWAMVFIFAVALVGFAVDTVLQPQQFKAQFTSGMTIDSRQGRLLLQENDFITDPNNIRSYPDLIKFFEHQKLLSLITSDSSIQITQGGQTQTLMARKKTISDLPAWFWVQIAAGVAVLIAAGRFWALRPFDVSSGYLHLAAVSVFVSLVASAVYSTRLLALPVLQFQIFHQLNIIGMALFGIAFITLFMIYPAQIPGWKLLINIQSLVFSTWTALLIIHAVPIHAHAGRIVAVQMIVLCLLILFQLLMTKPQSPARSKFLHLGGPTLVAAGGLAYLSAIDAVSFHTAYVFLFMLVIYIFNRWSKV